MGMHGWHRGLRRGFGDDIKEKPNVSKEMLLRILKYFLPHWKLMVLVFLCVGVTSVLGLLPPLLTRSIIDEALIKRSFRLLTLYTVGYVGISFLIHLIGVGESYLNTLISKRIVLTSETLCGVLQRVPSSFR